MRRNTLLILTTLVIAKRFPQSSVLLQMFSTVVMAVSTLPQKVQKTWKKGLFDQDCSCELPIFIKKILSQGPKDGPRDISHQFKLVEIHGTSSRDFYHELSRSLSVNCHWDNSVRPNENNAITDQCLRSHKSFWTPFQDGGRWLVWRSTVDRSGR